LGLDPNNLEWAGISERRNMNSGEEAENYDFEAFSDISSEYDEDGSESSELKSMNEGKE
jgi:hypothetical protein